MLSDLKILYGLTLRRSRGATLAERLEHFYKYQAEGYDRFRVKLLCGREEMIKLAIARIKPGGVWVDMGAGTGSNLEFVADHSFFKEITLVDLATSLLEQAKRRVARLGLNNVEVCCADASEFSKHGGADLITFSYSLTMMPDWPLVLERAREMLRPGGILAIVDFYVSHKHPHSSRVKHPWITRSLWPLWFAFDNVFLNADHLPYLATHFSELECLERRAHVPYVPIGKVPYYIFISNK